MFSATGQHLRAVGTLCSSRVVLLAILFGCLGLFAILAVPSLRADDAAPRYKSGQAEAAALAPRAAGGPEEDLRVFEPATVFGVPSAAQMMASPGTTIGETYYDYQHNSSTGRQVDESGGVIQASYMRQSLPQLSPGRKVFWNKVSVTGSAAPYVLDNGGTIRRFPLGVPASPLGTAVGPEDQQGYTTLRLTPNGRAAVFYHAIGALGSWAVAMDGAAGGGAFTGTVAPPPGVLADPIIWPHSAVDVVGGDTVLHVVGTWSGAWTEMWYWRGVVTAGTSTVTWSTPVPLDTTAGISAVVEADPTSDRVAVVYTRWGQTDLAYRLSTDGGLSWGSVVNVTNYTGIVPQRTWGNVAAVFDADGTLHVVYNSTAYSATSQYIPAMLWHWNDVRQTSRMIVAAYWQNTCSQTSPTRGQIADPQLSRPNISVKPAGAGPGGGIADELLYAVWVQFGPTDTDCATQADGATRGGFVNSEIWCSVSSNNGLTWDPPQNITGTKTPDCGLGNCHSEHWVSAAAVVDSGLYLSYVDDTHAGAIANTEGGWSLSPYKVLALEARTPVISPRQLVLPVDPVNWDSPLVDGDHRIILSSPPPGNTQNTIRIANLGNATLNYTATIINNGDASNVPLVNGAALHSGSIAAGAAAESLVVSYDPVGAKGYLDFRLEITSNDPEWNPGGGGKAFKIKWAAGSPANSYWVPLGPPGLNGGVSAMTLYNGKLIVGGGFTMAGSVSAKCIAAWDGMSWSPLGDGLNDYVLALAVYGNALYAGGYFTTAGGSPANHVARWDGNSWTALGQGTDDVVHALTVYSGKLFVGGEFANAGGSYIPHLASWNGNMWSGVGQGLNNLVYSLTVYDGKLIAGGQFEYSNFTPARYIASWDGTSWSALGGGAPNWPLALTVHNGDLIAGGSFYSWGGLADWNGSTWSALGMGVDGTVSAVCSFGNHLYAGGWFNYAGSASASCIASWDGSGWAALGSGTNDGVNDIIVYNNNLIVGGYFTTAGNRSMNRIAAWTGATACPIVVSGDVNVSGSITSADVITLVNYVFKSGLPPQPCEAAGDINCNGSVTSADVIALVNYVFKGGTPPCDACTSALASGC